MMQSTFIFIPYKTYQNSSFQVISNFSLSSPSFIVYDVNPDYRNTFTMITSRHSLG